jgi:hypothetical protein
VAELVPEQKKNRNSGDILKQNLGRSQEGGNERRWKKASKGTDKGDIQHSRVEGETSRTRK